MSVFTKTSRSRAFTLSGFAVVAASALVLAGCASAEPAEEENTGGTAGERDLTLKIGTILPQTGSLAYLGPPEESGVALAAKEINEADLGITVEVTYADSGDADNKAYATNVPKLLNADVSAIIGAAASGVSKLFIDDVTGAGVIQFSPANTSPDFTTWDDDGLYWRTAPSDLLQGEVLGNQIADDGNSALGIIYLNDAYGTGLEQVTSEIFTDAGGEVVASESFNEGDSSFDAQISAVLAEDPDSIALITFDQVFTIIPALKAAGFDMSKVYLVDGNLKQFGDELEPGSLTGAKGTLPGPVLEDDFQERLKAAWKEELNGEQELADFAYAPESYDATVLIALAAYAANSVEGKDIAAKLQEVSGGSGNGEKVTSFADGAKILAEGGVVDYDGYSGPITFDENGDPTEASIGVFEYGEDNNFTRIND